MISAHKDIQLHSAYNPEREAARFVDNQNIDFNPFYIVVCEPAESYLSAALHTRFPTAKLLAIRYTEKDFKNTDILWEDVWRPGESEDLENFLFQRIPEEYIPLTYFFSWKPSDNKWPKISVIVWKTIAKIIKLQTSIINTRSYFGRRWLKNSIRNILRVNNPVRHCKGHKNILLAAAGPSLQHHVPFDNQTWDILAVSSALTCLLKNGCVPNYCISTDGGYWALPHFNRAPTNLPLLFPLEAAIPSSMLETNPIVFLSYGSYVEKSLFSLNEVLPAHAVRNGTVSGTASLFALSNTDKNVYATGLDLRNSPSFVYARPHGSDVSLDILTNRFRPLATELYARNRDSEALEIYAAWFSSQGDDFSRRYFRLKPVGRKISSIQEIDILHAKKMTNNDVLSSGIFIEPIEIPAFNERKVKILGWLESIINGIQELKDINDGFTNPLYNELFQMISFHDYIHVLKIKNSRTDNKAIADAETDLIKKSIIHLQKLQQMVQRNEE